MAEQAKPMQELTGEVEFIELRPMVVKEQILRLFNNQIQRDYMIADFVELDGSILIKLKRRSSPK